MTELVLDNFEDDEFVLQGAVAPALVASIRVEGLYGRYSYTVHVPQQSEPDRLMLFYGDNGRGKTTVLRLLWHLLSPANDRGHRNAIASIAFMVFEVSLADGVRIRASRPLPVEGAYDITVFSSSGEVQSSGTWPNSARPFDDWTDEALERDLDAPREVLEEIEIERTRRRYLKVLNRIDAKPIFLADDRNIHSDEFDVRKSRPSPSEAIRWSNASSDSHRRHEVGIVAAELEESMRRATDFLRQMTLASTQTGFRDTNTVYHEVLRGLAAATPEQSDDPDLLPGLRDRVLTLSDRSRPFEALELVPEFPGEAFANALDLLTLDKAMVADGVLRPFLSSLDARLDALAAAESLITTFLRQTNGFLTDKRMVFRPRSGLRIVTEDGTRLSAKQLSSGERQLILLLCNALLARRGVRLFLVDEPELSLNVKWQRKIVKALLETTNGTPVQFIIATHSVEILSNYRSSVVKLESDVQR